MRAIVIRQPGGPEELVLGQLPDPEPAEGQVLIEVKAFGLNHAEVYFRSGAWPGGAPVTGIECAGLVRHDPGGRLLPGRKVVALVGGMGRSFNGSYAELVCVPSSNVVPVDTDMPWADLAALPESYATAWTCLQRNLAVKAGQVLLVRGATSALGQAAVNIASQDGVRVIATTRDERRFPSLRAIGAMEALLDGADLASRIRARFPHGIDAALDLVGTTTLLDTLACVRPDGRACMAGFLGGATGIPDFNPLMHLPSGVHLSFLGSAFVFGSESYPLSDIPFQLLVDRAAHSAYKARPAKVFAFEDIQQAHRLMESGQANGKIVVTV
jgi:NADPH:quinone reductase-like Zn-dependent oxidoreductase